MRSLLYLLLCLPLLANAALFKMQSPIHVTANQEQCLAQNIFYEAGVESVFGKYAVAQVTHNRVKKADTDFCTEVHRKAQFSWTLSRQLPPRGPLWEQSLKVAKSFLRGKRMVALAKATHYHATYVRPKWARSNKMAAVGKIGQHIFYIHS